ncbi:MAG: adenylate/guanylate cyclase domain-containing protein [Solirubrobacterales bacterium]|nr:adenylate/guanylate cyclase domain-containing protein [Solirubrobacterales bacterium]
MEETSPEPGDHAARRPRIADEPRLAGIAEVLAGARVAAELYDDAWNLVWVSEELKTLLGEQDEARIGYGFHVLEVRTNELWASSATEESQAEWSRANLGYVLHETPDEILAGLSVDMEGAPRMPEELKPEPAPPIWSYEIVYHRPGFQPLRITCIAARINDDDGSRIGAANLYTSALPAAMLDLLARGDERMFERMSRLIEPGRRQAAILFADLQASGTLSRRLPSAAYFRLIRSLTTAIDQVVGDFGGIVGKHAGDGVTAFFLADDLGSSSKAARAALEAAAGIAVAAAELSTGGPGDDGVPIDAADVLMNIGLHWGGALFMGQIVTGGRLEVTALGDEVNEGARIQQSAREGTALASKALIERLDPDDADAVGVDPERVVYRTVAELPDAAQKAIRDAGGIAVAQLSGFGDSPLPEAGNGPG